MSRNNNGGDKEARRPLLSGNQLDPTELDSDEGEVIFDRRSSAISDESGGSATKRLTYEEAVEEAACAEVIFQQLAEDQSLVLSCTPQQEQGHLVGLHLYHRGPQSQTTLLSVSEGSTVRKDPERGARLQLSGGLNSPRINVSISHLQLSDTGLYIWELSYRQNSSDQVILGVQRYFLLVEREGRSCGCSHGYIPLLLTISAAAGLLLLTVSLLAMEKCVRLRHHRPPQPHPPIYEEMSRKQQSAGSPKITREASPPPEEVNFPVYANPNIQQPQDNYYACPRQLAVRV